MNGQVDLEIIRKTTFKIFRSRLPSTVQGLVLVFARMIILNPIDTINFLTSFSIENRMVKYNYSEHILFYIYILFHTGIKNSYR